MKRSRFSEEQIIRILKEHEAGVSVADLCRKHGVSDASIYKWKAKFGGMDASEAKRLRTLEDENTRLKRLLADDAMLDNAVTSLAQARVGLRCWRADFNDARPHSRLGWKTPSEFAVTCHPRRNLALRYVEGSAPAPVATTAQPGKSNGRSELRIG